MSLIDLLNKRGINWEKTNNPNEVLISCTSGEHDDVNPSLSYNLEKDLFLCRSCGFKGSYSKFLNSIGEKTFAEVDSRLSYKALKIKNKIYEKTNKNVMRLPDDRVLYTQAFRGILPSTMKQFEAFTTEDENLNVANYICFPVYQHNKLKFIECRLQKDIVNLPKYKRKPQGSKSSQCLFPLDKLTNTNYVILVEGIFDMLNLWQLGYTNTLCIFGASNFNNFKLDLLDNLGVVKVDVFMDPDHAGQKAANHIYNMLSKRNIYARIIKTSGSDPGDLTPEEAESYLKNE